MESFSLTFVALSDNLSGGIFVQSSLWMRRAQVSEQPADEGRTTGHQTCLLNEGIALREKPTLNKWYCSHRHAETAQTSAGYTYLLPTCTAMDL
jgi:hypothetical protein